MFDRLWAWISWDLIMAWHGMAWHGMAWHGMAWHGMSCHVMACIALEMRRGVLRRGFPEPVANRRSQYGNGQSLSRGSASINT